MRFAAVPSDTTLSIMDGDLGELIGALQTEHQTEQLAALAGEE